MLTPSFIHANRGYLVGVVFSFLFFTDLHGKQVTDVLSYSVIGSLQTCAQSANTGFLLMARAIITLMIPVPARGQVL